MSSKLQRCSVCFQNNTHWQHSCKFYVWNICIQIWALTRITSDKLRGQESIPCLQQKWNDDILFSELQEWLTFEQMDKVYKAYNDNYISATRDITRWPRPGCDFAGVILSTKWKEPLMWPSCGYVWRDHSQLSRSEIAVKSFSNVMDLNPESFNYLNKLLCSTSWPNCGMTISKTEGWNHMLCQQCFYEFCWDCLGHYPGYVHQPGTVCGLRQVIIKFWLVLPLLLLVTNLAMRTSIFGFISIWADEFISKAFIPILALLILIVYGKLGLSLLALHLIANPKKKTKRRKLKYVLLFLTLTPISGWLVFLTIW